MHASEDKSEPDVIFVVDDDPSMLAAIRRLLISAQFAVEVFASGADLLANAQFDRPQCLILDVLMPGMSGLQVQVVLNERQVRLPIIFLTGHAEVPIAVEAMREGAVDFIEKPFDNDDLLKRIRRVIEVDRQRRQRAQVQQKVLLRLTTLTPRENEVLQQVVAGKTSKEVARALGSSHRTIEIHRGHIMKKMQVSTVAELVRMCMSMQAEDDVASAYSVRAPR